MGTFDELQKKLNSLAKEARDLLKAKQVDEIKGIPGEALWAGYNNLNQPTVKKNNQVLVVKATSAINLPLGSVVYIDETFTIQYKTKKPPKKEKKDEGQKANYNRRPFKRRRKVQIGPRTIKKIKGATWLVYHEYLKPLSLTTAAETATNPQLVGWSLFLSLLPLISLGGGVLLGVIYNTLFEFKVEPVPPIKISDLPTPANHPDLASNENLNADDYDYFLILQGVVDQLFTSFGLLAYPPSQTDGFWLGKNTAIGNYIFFIGQDNQATYGIGVEQNGLTFSDKYFIRPWTYTTTDQLVGLLLHFGPGKVQAALYRLVGVYPPKRFAINFHAWQVPDRDLPDLDQSSENYFELLRQLVPRQHKQFVIPDDIPEWNQIMGDGTLDPSSERSDIVPYELIPAHDFQTYDTENEPYDLTKFASYSQNQLFLSYIVKAYAPWTNLIDTLRINYYILNLRATYLPGDEGIEIAYNLKPSTFNIPPELVFDGRIYVEDPNFPLQAGERNVATRQITYKIIGTEDPLQATGILNISALRGDNEKRGLLIGSDPDAVPAILDPQGSGKYAYFPGRSLKFEVFDAPEGFFYEQNTGEYVFDQNISRYGNLGTGQAEELEFTYAVTAPNGQQATGTIKIFVLGSSSTFISNGPAPLEAVTIDASSDAQGPPEHEWDPEPIIEADTTGETQVFDKVTTLIPLPETDVDGNVWGWAGRAAQIDIVDVSPPIIKLKVGDVYYDNPAGFSADDFIFSATTDATRLGKVSNFKTDFTVKSANYDKLAPGDELSITYTIEGLLNNAPFVGNFEDLNDFQKRKIQSDVIQFAFPGDWRGSIYNPREESPNNNIFATVLDDSATRDTPQLPVLNIDIARNDLTANWIREFYWYSEESGKEDPKMALLFTDEQGVSKSYEDEYLKVVNLVWDFSSFDKELLFYAPDDVRKLEPLDDQSIQDAINSAAQIQIKKRWVWDLLPSGTDRSEESGTKWRVDREYSDPLKGYIIFGWSD